MPAKTVTHPPKSWRFRVSKLGALAHGGEFEIKPLTLFCGKNNTGKTWAMYAAYGFLQARSVTPSMRSSSMPKNFFKRNRFLFKAWLKRNCDHIIASTNENMNNHLPTLFNADKGLFNGTKFEWVSNESNLINNAIQSEWQREFNFPDATVIAKKEKGEEHIEFTSNRKLNFEFSFARVSRKINVDLNSPLILNIYGSFVSSALISCRRAFLMPAERCGLQLFYQELRARRTALLHHASKKGINLEELLRDVMKSRYAKPIADYIDWLNCLSDEKPNSPYSKIAELLAIKLAGGKYRVDKEGNIFFTPQKANGAKPEEMELHTTSSTVKSMFGLWYYLSRDAKRGDVIMIDEPELNLHPANQRALARLLAQLVNAGLYVVASTHSDYIVREVNTLIMLNRKDAKRASLMKKYKISEGEVLSPTLVGAYEMSAKTGRIEPMKIDKEGINAKTLDEVIVAQGEENDEVHYSLAK